MNIFVIPSWYPSADYPISGIMIKEQFEAICRMQSSIQVGISLWGQKENQYLLWAKDHFKNFRKLRFASRDGSVSEILPNLKEYRKPTFTWTQHIAKGNLSSIVKANLHNLKAFEADFGPVQLIHAQAAQPAGRIALEVSKKTGIPYCITERMGPFPSIFIIDKKGQVTAAYREAYQYSIANIAVSPFQATRMKSHGIEKIKVIPDFANEIFFQPGEASTSNRFTFFVLGRIEFLKGMRELMEAMQLLLAQHKNINLRIGGVGPQAEVYKNLSEELHLENAVTWLGNLSRKEVLTEYQKCDAFVLPSHYESFGISFIEALACGKPVIATKCGGPESIVNSNNGLLVEKEDPVGLAKAMQNMIEKYDRYKSSQIRQDFLNRFSSQAVVPQMMEFYSNIIYDNTSRRCE